MMEQSGNNFAQTYKIRDLPNIVARDPYLSGGSIYTYGGASIGRGFHADSDDNASDFMEQIEPSPWMRNLTEVRR